MNAANTDIRQELTYKYVYLDMPTPRIWAEAEIFLR